MKSISPSHEGSKRASALLLIGLPLLAGSLFPALSVLGATPADPAVELRFPEGTNGYGGAGVTTTNTGFLEGVATFATDDPTDFSGYPMFTNNVPTGTYTPSGNSYSVDMGPVYGTNYGRAVDLSTTANPPGNGTVGAFDKLTVCGWLNCRYLPKNSRIAYALESAGGLGFELATHEYGPLALGINENAGLGTMSVTKLTQDPDVGNNNWWFFAATYDPSLGANQLKYYFGKPDQLAYLDSEYTYTGGDPNTSVIQYTGPLTVGNFGVNDSARDNTGNYEPIQMFQGLLDEMKVYTNAFTIDQVQQAQVNGTVTPVAASVLDQPADVTALSGQNAFFNVRATGSGVVTYQWYTSINKGTNWTQVIGATNASLTLASVSLTDNGKWLRVGVSNSVGGVVSTSAIVTVQSAAPQVIQLSFTEASGKQTTNAAAYFGQELITANTPGITQFCPQGPMGAEY
jgi:hypothetical protein